MSEMTIIVEYETLEGAEPEFTRILSDHAHRTRAEEPGCLRFDVLKPLGEDGEPLPNRIIANEVYEDREAVSIHQANPRLAALRANLAPLLKSRRLLLSRSILEHPPEEGIAPAELNAANDD